MMDGPKDPDQDAPKDPPKDEDGARTKRILSMAEARAADIARKHPDVAARAMRKPATIGDVLAISTKIVQGVALELYKQFAEETSAHLQAQDHVLRQQIDALEKRINEDLALLKERIERLEYLAQVEPERRIQGP